MRLEEMNLQELKNIIDQQEKKIYELKRFIAEQQLINQELNR